MKQGETPQWKLDEVDTMVKLILDNPVTAVVNLENLPSRQLLKMKQSLRGEAIIKMSKISVMSRALEKSKRGALVEFLKGQPALLVSQANPFKLSKKLKDSKVKSAAKAGQAVPYDIVIPEGETTFSPGPIVGELGKMGVKAGIVGGKVVIRQESTLAKEGEILDQEKADMLVKMSIEPMEIGLSMVAAYEDGLVYGSDVLDIDTDSVLAKMQDAYRGAFNLAFNISYPTKQNIELFVQKAFREAKGLATEANYVCAATVGDVLGKASRAAAAIKSNLKEAPSAEGEVPKEEAQVEEKKDEGAAAEGEAPAEEVKEEPAAEEKPAEEVKEEEKKE